MFVPRKIESRPEWCESNGVRIHTITVHPREVERSHFRTKLADMLTTSPIATAGMPGFAIFHEGQSRRYLILGHWDNDNELFVRTAVETESGWEEDPRKFSFCVHDMEVFQKERRAFLNTIDTESPDPVAYRHAIPAYTCESSRT